jgi:hypothetical protein
MPSQQEGYLVQYAQEEGGTLECGGQRVINEPASWDYSYEMYGTSDQITSAGYTYTMSTGHQANGCRGVGSTSTFCFETLDPQIGIRHGTAGTREYWYANLDPGVFKASRDHVSPNQGDDSFVDKALSDLLGFVSGRAFGWDFSSVANLFPTGPSPKYTPVDNGNEDYMQFNYDDLAAHSEGMRVNVQFYDNNHGLSYNRVHGAIQGIGTVYDFSNGHAYPVVQLTHTIELETTVTINHT